ncbi:hypothetical protein LPJ75_000999 [Coemansia sp. RSA 2598]|nr:hypothetical protein LPJ75_000999 [Coemansia sp. RSA 2598]
MFESLTSPAIEPLALEGVVVTNTCQQTHLPPVLPVVEPLALEEAVEVAVDEEAGTMPARPMVEPLALEGVVEADACQQTSLPPLLPVVESHAPRGKNKAGKCVAFTERNPSPKSSAPAHPAAEQRAPRRVTLATRRSALVMETSKDIAVQRLESSEVVRAAMKPIHLLAAQSRGSCSKFVPETKKTKPSGSLASSSTDDNKAVSKRLIPEGHVCVKFRISFVGFGDRDSH